MCRFATVEESLEALKQFVAKHLPDWTIETESDLPYCSDALTRTLHLNTELMRQVYEEEPCLYQLPGAESVEHMLIFCMWHEVGHAIHLSVAQRLGKWDRVILRRAQEEQSVYAEVERAFPDIKTCGWGGLPASLKRQSQRWYATRIRSERVADRFARWATGLPYYYPAEEE